MKKIITLLFAIFLFATAYAEVSVPFNGLVVDQDGLGIKTQIEVKDSDKRTASGKDGKFGLTNLMATDVLVVRYKKHRFEIALEGRNSIKIEISDSGELISVAEDAELIAAGAEYVKRRELPSKGGVLTADMIAREGFTTLSDALRAKAPTLIIDGSGSVTIRGVNSIGNHAPALIVCDGMEIASLDVVNVNDVASVEIQKDGTLYGFRGVGGVIVIKTKSGSKR